MNRLLRHVLIALVLLFSQQAALLHVMDHAMGSATGDTAGQPDDGFAFARGEQNTPQTGHPAEQCLAFHAIDSAMPGGATAGAASCRGDTAVARFVLPLAFAPRVVFDSRAPPPVS